ncbi:MAG: glutamate formimidoyltransferase [bacterium]
MLVECVPNFSEGTDQTLIDEIIAAVKTAKILDLHSDPDHNRSVVTMIGNPQDIKQAAFDLTERAMQLLDVKSHAGVHPFIGVVDVMPFISIGECPKSEVIRLANELGQDLWQKLKLPVYFYGEAAKITERKELPYVRKGGYSVLKQEIDAPHRRPDVGHGLHQTAGAVAVGVRDFLIAFNVNLRTTDVDLARSIAKNLRVVGVRALGLELKSRGITQVSMNIVDHPKTPLKTVFDEVKKWAKEYQVEIIESEIVGLIPASAAFEGMKDYLRLRSFSEEKILENLY